MLSTQTALDAYFMPQDRDVALEAILFHLKCAKQNYRQRMFGFAHPVLADAITEVHSRGIDTWLMLDHSQYASVKTDAALVHRMILNGFPAERICITTSPMHQIMHSKMSIIDADVDIPDAQFETVEAAAKAGYPRIIEGSLNWSLPGFKQSNSMLVLPSKVLASYSAKDFDEHWIWAMNNEPLYQKEVV